VLSALLGLDHALVHAEMPVHVRGLLLLALLVVLEAAAALCAGDTETLIKAHD
jgi:hypothetical protein